MDGADPLIEVRDRLRTGAALVEGAAGGLWDIGDDVACFEVRTKLNVLSDEALDLLERALELIPGRFRGLVLTGAGERAFSVGGDLSLFAHRLGARDWGPVEAFLRRGVGAYQALQDAPYPVVAAVFGLALGGGCELFLHCASVVAHADLRAGLPEAKVGLIPAWGGCTQMLHRAQSRAAPDAAEQVFDAILAARVSSSALDASAMGVLRETDIIVADRGQLLTEARRRVVVLAERAWVPPSPVRLRAGGRPLRDALLGRHRADPAAPYDRVIAERVAFVLAGGDAAPGETLSRGEFATLERDALMELVRRPETLARVEHMLTTGKPLRN